MRLYHGSTVEITHIDLSKSKPNKDFGRAFYLYADEQQAMEMAHFVYDHRTEPNGVNDNAKVYQKII